MTERVPLEMPAREANPATCRPNVTSWATGSHESWTALHWSASGHKEAK